MGQAGQGGLSTQAAGRSGLTRTWWGERQPPSPPLCSPAAAGASESSPSRVWKGPCLAVARRVWVKAAAWVLFQNTVPGEGPHTLGRPAVLQMGLWPPALAAPLGQGSGGQGSLTGTLQVERGQGCAFWVLSSAGTDRPPCSRRRPCPHSGMEPTSRDDPGRDLGDSPLQIFVGTGQESDNHGP